MARYGKRFAKIVKQARKRPEYWVSKITLDFANSLDRLLTEKGMSKKDLADKIDSSPAYITKVLRGDANYQVETMVKLAMAVDAQVEVRLVPKAQVMDWRPIKEEYVGRGFQPMKVGTTAVASNSEEWQSLSVVA